MIRKVLIIGVEKSDVFTAGQAQAVVQRNPGTSIRDGRRPHSRIGQELLE